MKPEHDEALVEQRHREAAAELIESYWFGAGEDRDQMRKLAKSYRDGHTQGVWAHAFARFEQSIRTTDAARIAALEAEALKDAVSTNTENCRQRDALAFHLKATTEALAAEIAEYEGFDEPALVAWLGEDMGRRIIRAQMAVRAARATLRSNTNETW